MANEAPTSLFFEEEPELARQGTPPVKAIAASVARVLMPNRSQLELRASDLESLLPEGHRARMVWAYVEQADLSRIYAGIKAVEGGSGRSAATKRPDGHRSPRKFYSRCGYRPRWTVWAVHGRSLG